MKQHYIPYRLAAAIAVVAFITYLPALQNEFVNWDDDIHVYNNLHIRSIDWQFIKWAFTNTSQAGFWYPVVWISHAFDYALWGLNPAGHHFTNILIHAFNTFLASLLIIKLLEIGQGDRCTGMPADKAGCYFSGTGVKPFALTAAGCAGILFAIHPLRVESVAWASERKDLLCAMFYLSSIMAYLRYAHNRAIFTLYGATTGPPDGSRLAETKYRGMRPYVLSLCLFVMALSSKPMAVTLPAVLMLLDWYPLKRISTPRESVTSFLEKAPFFACSLIISWATLYTQGTVGAMPSLEAISIPTRVLLACGSLMAYLWKIGLPIDLNPLYPHPEHISFFTIDHLLGVMLTVAITIATLFAVKRSPVWFTAWGYFVITLFPVLGLFQAGTQAMADRFTYLPGLGPFVLIGLVSARTWEKAKSAPQWSSGLKIVLGSIALVACICMVYGTIRQVALWKNSVIFWNHVINLSPYRNSIAYNNRGIALELQGQYLEAIEDFNTAVSLKPDYAEAYVSRGWIYKRLGFADLALKDFDLAVQLNPRQYLAYYHRGVLFGESGENDLAVRDFTAAIRIDPDFGDAFASRGLAYINSGLSHSALADLQTAITMDPLNSDAYLNRGVVYETEGQLVNAIMDYSKVIELDPSDYVAYANRGRVMAASGRIREAVSDYSQALSLKKDYGYAYLERGNCFRATGEKELARKDYQRACELGIQDACAVARGI
jgi:protein O-mannosyl-transferase